MVATAHTHPNSNSFSSTDINNAIARNMNTYVIGPDLNLQRYSIDTGAVSIVGTATPMLLTDSQRNELVSQFQVSWDEHVAEGCGFDCSDMTWPTP